MSSASEFSERRLVLASGSIYRATLIQNLFPDIECIAPDIDESPLAGESAENLVARLASNKAALVAGRLDSAVVIGSDQVALNAGKILTKPGNFANAEAQLAGCSGEKVRFYTGLCVIDGSSGQTLTGVEHFDVKFRHLSAGQIDNYLRREQPYDCAGSFKSEGLGIALFEEFSGRDPNTLVGLPLMLLTDYLMELGLDPLG